MNISPVEPLADFKSTSKHGTTRAALRSMTLQVAGKTKQCLFARLNIIIQLKKYT